MKTKREKPTLFKMFLLLVMLINIQELLSAEAQDESGQAAKGKKITIEVLPPEDDDPLDTLRDSSEPNKSFGIEDLGGLIEKVTRNRYYPYLPGVPNQAYMSQYYMPNMIGYPFTGAPVGGMPRFKALDGSFIQSGNATSMPATLFNNPLMGGSTAMLGGQPIIGGILGQQPQTMLFPQGLVETQRNFMPQGVMGAQGIIAPPTTELPQTLTRGSQNFAEFPQDRGQSVLYEKKGFPSQSSPLVEGSSESGTDKISNDVELTGNAISNRLAGESIDGNSEAGEKPAVYESDKKNAVSNRNFLKAKFDEVKASQKARFLEMKLSQALQTLNQLTEEAEGISVKKNQDPEKDAEKIQS